MLFLNTQRAPTHPPRYLLGLELQGHLNSSKSVKQSFYIISCLNSNINYGSALERESLKAPKRRGESVCKSIETDEGTCDTPKVLLTKNFLRPISMMPAEKSQT